MAIKKTAKPKKVTKAKTARKVGRPKGKKVTKTPAKATPKPRGRPPKKAKASKAVADNGLKGSAADPKFYAKDGKWIRSD